MMLTYKNGPLKYQWLHFYTINIVHAIEYYLYCPHMRVLWWKRYSNACRGAPCRNCPISRFSTGATISIFYNEQLHVRQQVLGRDGQWVITVSYNIGIVGAIHLWEVADPKNQTLCRNSPALPYSRYTVHIFWLLTLLKTVLPFVGRGPIS